MKVLFDSDAFYALTVDTDPHHNNSKEIYSRILTKKYNLFTSSLVLHETATLLSYRINQTASFKFLQVFEKLPINTIFFDQSLESQTWQIFKQQTKKGTSFIDCSNIAIYKHFKMDYIFSFDKIYTRNKVKLFS